MTQSCEVSRRPESITIEPVSAASGTVRLPGSKSISNRALFLAAMVIVGRIQEPKLGREE